MRDRDANSPARPPTSHKGESSPNGITVHSASLTAELELPKSIVARLAEAGKVADLENPTTSIAEAVLGDLLESSGNLPDVVTEQRLIVNLAAGA